MSKKSFLDQKYTTYSTISWPNLQGKFHFFGAPFFLQFLLPYGKCCDIFFLVAAIGATQDNGDGSRRKIAAAPVGYVPAAVPFPNHDPATPLGILAERRAKPMRIFEATIQVATILIVLADLFLRVRKSTKRTSRSSRPKD